MLASDVDGLALALTQAAGFIEKYRISFGEYRQRWQANIAKVSAWHDAPSRAAAHHSARVPKPPTTSAASAAASGSSSSAVHTATATGHHSSGSASSMRSSSQPRGRTGGKSVVRW